MTVCRHAVAQALLAAHEPVSASVGGVGELGDVDVRVTVGSVHPCGSSILVGESMNILAAAVTGQPSSDDQPGKAKTGARRQSRVSVGHEGRLA